MKTEKVTVKTSSEKIVGEMHVQDGKLEGVCTWFDLHGKIISKGSFKEGKPYEGEIVNWAVIFQELKDGPFEVENYCQDWVSQYSAFYRSEIPDFSEFLQTYKAGRQVRGARFKE